MGGESLLSAMAAFSGYKSLSVLILCCSAFGAKSGMLWKLCSAFATVNILPDRFCSHAIPIYLTSRYAISYCSISSHTVSFCAVFRCVISCYIASFRIISCCAVRFYIVSFCTVFRRIISCYIISVCGGFVYNIFFYSKTTFPAKFYFRSC